MQNFSLSHHLHIPPPKIVFLVPSERISIERESLSADNIKNSKYRWVCERECPSEQPKAETSRLLWQNRFGRKIWVYEVLYTKSVPDRQYAINFNYGV